MTVSRQYKTRWRQIVDFEPNPVAGVGIAAAEPLGAASRLGSPQTNLEHLWY